MRVLTEAQKIANRARVIRWQKKFPEKAGARNKRWNQKNREFWAERQARERIFKFYGIKKDSHPAILKIYKKAKALTVKTGIPHEVDHIYPLKHSLFCGLHVPSNLRIVSQSVNRKKANKISSQMLGGLCR